MPLVDLRTNLKSLRYGKDRIGGGSSNQPYITRELPESFSDVGRKGGPDFLLRGGTLVPGRALRDVSRLTQMFFDFKTPNGPLFIAKQNLLALSGTNFKAGFDSLNLRQRKTDLKGIDRALDSVGTFLQNNVDFNQDNIYTPLSTLGQAAGNAIGLHLYKQGLNPFTGPTRYEEYAKDKSRVVSLYNNKLIGVEPNLYEYIGGPGSINGIGRTRIKRFENTNPDPRFLAANPGFLGYSDLQLLANNKRDLGPGNTSLIDFRNFSLDEDSLIVPEDELPPIQSFTGLNNTKVKTLDYATKNIEDRVNLGNPGKKLKDQTLPLDKINAFPLYKSGGVKQVHEKNDLVKFRIAVIDNDNPSEKTFIHFRAFLDQMSDGYTSQWDSFKYMGRGENFYRYQGFDRTISLGWTVAAQSRAELIPMYQKLNYLASSLTPHYSKEVGYMGGNLVELTVGGWFFNQPGIITSMTLDVPNESPWEIGINTIDERNTLNAGQEKVKSDKAVKEMPLIVRVTNFNFIPIHKFVPQIQRNKYNNPGGYLSAFGRERYIALENGDNNNYGTSAGNEVNKAPNYIGDNNYKTGE